MNPRAYMLLCILEKRALRAELSHQAQSLSRQISASGEYASRGGFVLQGNTVSYETKKARAALCRYSRVFNWARRIRTFTMTESESVALPFGDSPLSNLMQPYFSAAVVIILGFTRFVKHFFGFLQKYSQDPKKPREAPSQIISYIQVLPISGNFNPPQSPTLQTASYNSGHISHPSSSAPGGFLSLQCLHC